MKAIDATALTLVIVGALNWGLIGVANFDLVKALFGTTIVSSIVYALVGAGGIYLAAQWKAMHRRWSYATGVAS